MGLLVTDLQAMHQFVHSRARGQGMKGPGVVLGGDLREGMRVGYTAGRRRSEVTFRGC